MNGNIWEAICDHLGVEPDEPFKLKFGVHDEPHPYNLYKIVSHGKAAGLYFQPMPNNCWEICDISVNRLLGIGTTAIQEPWKPKKGENFWYVLWQVGCNNVAGLEVSQTNYALNYSPDVLRVSIGNCFKTEEQAESKMYEIFKSLTGQTWQDWCKENGYTDANAN